MKQILKRILFITIISFGASLATYAQRQEKPPKKDPPIVVVPDRKGDKPKDDKKEDDKRPRKPAAATELSIISSVEIFD